MHQPHVTGFAALGRGGWMAQLPVPLKRLWIHLPTSASSIPTWLCFPDRQTLPRTAQALLRYANRFSQGPRRVNLLSASPQLALPLNSREFSDVLFLQSQRMPVFLSPGGLESASISASKHLAHCKYALITSTSKAVCVIELNSLEIISCFCLEKQHQLPLWDALWHSLC